MRKFSFGILIPFISALLVIMFWQNNILLTSLLLLLSVLVFVFLWKDKKGIITFLVGAFFGGVMEAICIYFNVWSYSNPTYLIPMWLPVLWGMTALVLRRFTLIIEKR